MVSAAAAGDGDCVKTGCSADARDAQGCCPRGKRDAGLGQKPSKGKCPAGMEVGEYTKERCCWPGQGWNGDACVGTPTRCLEGAQATVSGCEEIPCDPGMVKLEGKHCCWPGQAWAGRCVGAPTRCPDDREVSGEVCAPSSMVLVPAGEFWMGCSASDIQCAGDEKPGKKVRLDAFKIDRTEVTVDAYKACVDAGRCSPPNTTSSFCSGTKAHLSNWGQAGRGDHPINCVTWDQADTYCKAQGKQLPTEAQWEKAARGTDERLYPWGYEAPSCRYAVIFGEGDQPVSRQGCGEGSTWPVGSKPEGASPYGALDMSGNVWEHIADWYDYSAYGSSSNTHLTGPSSGTTRVNRGGSFEGNLSLRASSRGYRLPSVADVNLGFRCVAPATP